MCSPNLIAILQWAKLEKNSTKNNAECLAKLSTYVVTQSLLINGNIKASTICIFLLIFYPTVNRYRKSRMFRYSITKYLQNQTTKQIADDGSAFFLTFLEKKCIGNVRRRKKCDGRNYTNVGKKKVVLCLGPIHLPLTDGLSIKCV